MYVTADEESTPRYLPEEKAIRNEVEPMMKQGFK